MKLSRILILLFLTASLLIHNTNGTAQNIGINTSGAVPNSSSLLDIDAAPGNNKGLLIPRMALVSSTDATTITSPATSLLVYHIGSGGLPVAGYYYNSGTSGSPVWVQLLNGGSPGTAWMLTGNTGTTGGPNFLGTKDNISLRFRTNNTQRFIIDSLGNVGIGILSPASKLTIASTGYNGFEDMDGSAEVHIGTQLAAPNTLGEKARLAIQPYGHTGGPFNIIARDISAFAFLDFRYGALTEPTLFTLRNDGYVGIGTASPGAKLEVKAGTEGQTSATTAIKIWGPNSPGNSSSAQDLQWGFAAAGSAKIRAYRGGSWDTYLQFLTNANAEGGDTAQVRMTISENGNVGIGTTAPVKKLFVESSTSDAIWLKGNTGGATPYVSAYITAESNNDYRGRGLFLPSSAAEANSSWFVGVPYTGGGFQIGASSVHTSETANGPYVQSSAKIFIQPNGNVGIATTSPGAPLTVAQEGNYSYPNMGTSAKGAINIRMATSGMSSGLTFSQAGVDNSQAGIYVYQHNSPGTTMHFATTNSYATGPQVRMTVLDNGNVGIGATAPLSKLQINGDLATQNGQVKREFLTWNTSANTNVMIHIKTNITCASIMYRFLIEGYNYGTAKAINSEAVGYAYSGTGTIISNQNIDHSAGVISSQYLSTDGFVVLRLNPNGSNYFIGFSVSGWFVNPTGTAFNISGVVYHQNADL
ncbi:MAG: hypothetical protein V4549_19465 [Bacteroidota bacterium]